MLLRDDYLAVFEGDSVMQFVHIAAWLPKDGCYVPHVMTTLGTLSDCNDDREFLGVIKGGDSLKARLGRMLTAQGDDEAASLEKLWDKRDPHISTWRE